MRASLERRRRACTTPLFVLLRKHLLEPTDEKEEKASNLVLQRLTGGRSYSLSLNDALSRGSFPIRLERLLCRLVRFAWAINLAVA
jgi:hypothetical protein